MYTLILTCHFILCFFLVGVVLLQQGKGAQMGATLGGGSNTLFGSGGATALITRLTTGAAVCFMITSIALIKLTPEATVVASPDSAALPEVDPEGGLTRALEAAVGVAPSTTESPASGDSVPSTEASSAVTEGETAPAVVASEGTASPSSEPIAQPSTVPAP